MKRRNFFATIAAAFAAKEAIPSQNGIVCGTRTGRFDARNTPNLANSPLSSIDFTSLISGESVEEGDFVELGMDGLACRANGKGSFVFGVATESARAGQPVTIQMRGFYPDDRILTE